MLETADYQLSSENLVKGILNMLFEHNKNLSLYSASVQEPLIYSSPFNSINFLNKKTTLESKTQDEDKKLSKNPNVIRTIKKEKIIYCKTDS